MVAKLQTLRTDGSIQFDSELSTYSYLGRGAVQTTSPPYGTSTSRALVPMARASDRIVAVRCTGYTLARAGSGLRSENADYDAYMTDAPVGTTVEYFVFDRTTALSAAGPGLNTYNAAGALTFSSSLRPMLITGLLTSVSQSLSLSAGRNYAFVMAQFGGSSTLYYDDTLRQQVDDQGRTQFYYYDASQGAPLYGIYTDPNRYSFQGGRVSYADSQFQYIVSNGAQPPTNPSHPPSPTVVYDIDIGYVLFIDVTNF